MQKPSLLRVVFDVYGKTPKVVKQVILLCNYGANSYMQATGAVLWFDLHEPQHIHSNKFKLRKADIS